MGSKCCSGSTQQDKFQILSNNNSHFTDKQQPITAIDNQPFPISTFPQLQNETVQQSYTRLGSINYPDEYNKSRDQTDPTTYVVLEYCDGTIYEGNLKNKRRQGLGRQVYSDGSYYEGWFGMDIQQGYGRFVYCNGDVYEGEFRNDKAHGKGTYTGKEGDVYVGEWKNDKQDGEGYERFKDGSEYRGIYKNGKKHGYGVYKWNDGCKYEGDFKQNFFHGQGNYFWNSQKYTGQWYHSLMHGYGILESRNGKCKYIGQFYNGVKHGYGEFELDNGRIYKGSWESGNWVQGVYVKPDGSSQMTTVLEEVNVSINV